MNAFHLDELMLSLACGTWDKQEKATLESARARYIAAEWAIGGPEQALVWAKLEAKEARFDLDEPLSPPLFPKLNREESSKISSLFPN